MTRLTAGFIAACALAFAASVVAHAMVQSAGQVPLDRFGVPVKQGPSITEMEFFFKTTNDAKAGGEAINIQVLKSDMIVYDSGWVQGEPYNPNTSHNWFAPWAGAPIKVPVSTTDCGSLKLRVEKQGDKGWSTTVRVLGNERSLVLMAETPDVKFSARKAATVNEVLDGLGGAKIQHTDGGNFHVFSFTCKA
jgi:hypothetical protein